MAKRRLIFKKAESYVREYRKGERALVNARRQAKDGNNFYLEPEPKLAFVIRIRGYVVVVHHHHHHSSSSGTIVVAT